MSFRLDEGIDPEALQQVCAGMFVLYGQPPDDDEMRRFLFGMHAAFMYTAIARETGGAPPTEEILQATSDQGLGFATWLQEIAIRARLQAIHELLEKI